MYTHVCSEEANTDHNIVHSYFNVFDFDKMQKQIFTYMQLTYAESPHLSISSDKISLKKLCGFDARLSIRSIIFLRKIINIYKCILFICNFQEMPADATKSQYMPSIWTLL